MNKLPNAELEEIARDTSVRIHQVAINEGALRTEDLLEVLREAVTRAYWVGAEDL